MHKVELGGLPMESPTLKPAPSLFSLIQEMSDDVFQLEHLRGAVCWDTYGLPDGTLNPTHGSDTFHATMSPSEEAVNVAFDSVLTSLLSEDEHWLVRIPRRLGNLRTLDARAYYDSRSGGAALVLPGGVFGGLFYINEVQHALGLRDAREERTSFDETLRDYIVKNFHSLFAHWLLLLPSIKLDISYLTLEMYLDALRSRRTPEERYRIWATTVSQQVFLLLHELGHLAQADFDNKTKLSTKLYQFNFLGAEEELKADEWAMRHLLNGIPNVFEDGWFGLDWIQSALFTLFGAIEVLRRNHYLSMDRDEIAERMYRVRKWHPLMGKFSSKEKCREQLTDIESFFLAPSPPRMMPKKRWWQFWRL